MKKQFMKITSMLCAAATAISLGTVYADYHEENGKYFYEDFNSWTGANMNLGDEYSLNRRAVMPYLHRYNSEEFQQYVSWRGTENDGYAAIKSNTGAPWNSIVFTQRQLISSREVKGFDVDWLNFTGSIVASIDVRIPEQGRVGAQLIHVYSSSKANEPMFHSAAMMPYIQSKNGVVTVRAWYGNSGSDGAPMDWLPGLGMVLQGAKPGDWVQLSVVLTRDAENIVSGENYARYSYKCYVNGSQIVDDSSSNPSQGVINPNIKQNIHSSISTFMESMNYDGGYPANYKGFGFQVQVDDCQTLEYETGIDNMCMRVYEGTTVSQVIGAEPLTGEDNADEAEIPFMNTALDSDEDFSAACGIVDINYKKENGISVEAVKYAADDILMMNGEDITSNIEVVDNRENCREDWNVKDGDNTKIYPNGNFLKIKGLDIKPNEKVVLNIKNAVDVLGNELSGAKTVIYNKKSDALGIIKSSFYDINGDEQEIKNESGGYVISAAIKKMRFTTADTNDLEVLIKDSEENIVKKADFEDGVYTVDMEDDFLNPFSEYSVYHDGVLQYSFKTDEGKFEILNAQCLPATVSVSYANSTSEKRDFYILGMRENTGVVKCETVSAPASKSGDIGVDAAGMDKVFTTEQFYNSNTKKDLNVFAVSVGENVKEYKINGKIQPDSQAFYVLFDKGNDWKGTERNNVAAAVKLAKPVVSDESGVINSSFILPEGLPAGTYAVALFNDGKIYYDRFSYADAVETENAINLLNGAKSAEEAFNIIESHYGELTLINETYEEKMNDEQKLSVAKLLYNFTASGEKVTAGKDGNINDIFNQCVMAASFEKNLDVSIADFKGAVSYLSEAPFADWISSADDARIKNINNRLLGKSAKSIADFRKNLAASVVFSVIDNCDSQENITKLIKDFSGKNYINLDEKYIVPKVMNKLWQSGKSYSGFDYTELKSDLDNYLKANTSANGSGSTSGGGGGGGSTISKATLPSSGGVTVPDPIDRDNDGEGFSDLEDVEWAKEAILALKNKDIVSGKDEKNFAPSDNITREEFSKIMVRALNLELLKDDTTFKDVKDGEWYYEYVNTAYENKLLQGKGDGVFGIGEDITRQDMFVIIYNALKLRGKAENSEKSIDFKDKDDISEYAVDAVKCLCEMNIINGYEDGTIRPQLNATRAETAKLVYEILPYLE